MDRGGEEKTPPLHSLGNVSRMREMRKGSIRAIDHR